MYLLRTEGKIKESLFQRGSIILQVAYLYSYTLHYGDSSCKSYVKVVEWLSKGRQEGKNEKEKSYCY